MSERTTRPPAPAPLVLGVLAGILAAVAVLPTAIPITMRLVTAEHTLAIRHAQNAATLAARTLEHDDALAPGTRERLEVDHLHVTSDDGLLVFQEGVELPGDVYSTACPVGDLNEPAGETIRATDGSAWAVSCVPIDGYRVVAAWKPPQSAATEIAVLVLALAAIVGIVTALGVLRLLAPLSRVSAALERVGAGERGVRLGTTGLSELDHLVDRLNVAARSVEDREKEFLDRIRVIQEMSRMVAHEVRNPLQSLELLTSLIASSDEEAERQELAQSIHEEIRGLDMVVDRVLRQGVTGSGMTLRKAPHTLRPVIDQVVALRTPESKAQGISIEVGDVVDRALPIDTALLGRSIENLVLNAMQAVPPRRGKVRISAQEDGDYVCIVVEDNGPGVPEAFGDAIYEVDVTGRTGGTGLGLALVKGVIEAHGGYVEHDRSPLGGARFRARIPLSEVQVAG